MFLYELSNKDQLSCVVYDMCIMTCMFSNEAKCSAEEMQEESTEGN